MGEMFSFDQTGHDGTICNSNLGAIYIWVILL